MKFILNSCVWGEVRLTKFFCATWKSFVHQIQNHMYLVDIIISTHKQSAQNPFFYKNPTSVSESFPLWRSFHFLCAHNSHPVVLGFSIFCDFTETSCSCSSFISSLSTRAPRVELTSKFSSDDIGGASCFP